MKIYIVGYNGGSYEDSYDEIIFATTDKDVAEKYVTKFNNILKKWKQYYAQFEVHSEVIGVWLRDDAKQFSDRWYWLQDIDGCYCIEVPTR